MIVVRMDTYQMELAVSQIVILLWAGVDLMIMVYRVAGVRQILV